jgi:predicted enzyme involved in methoxymalonyl-ACP biosynthesis
MRQTLTKKLYARVTPLSADRRLTARELWVKLHNVLQNKSSSSRDGARMAYEECRQGTGDIEDYIADLKIKYQRYEQLAGQEIPKTVRKVYLPNNFPETYLGGRVQRHCKILIASEEIR